MLNRRAWTAGFDHEITQALADDRPLGVVMFDLDHFKLLNDRLGHAAGDRALRGFAEILSTVCGPGDLTARSGGEEFAVCLPGRTAADAFAGRVAGALRERSRAEQAPLTVSADVAELTPRQNPALVTSAALLHAADQAHYGAKESGRDRGLMHTPRRPAPADESPATADLRAGPAAAPGRPAGPVRLHSQSAKAQVVLFSPPYVTLTEQIQ